MLHPLTLGKIMYSYLKAIPLLLLITACSHTQAPPQRQIPAPTTSTTTTSTTLPAPLPPAPPSSTTAAPPAQVSAPPNTSCSTADLIRAIWPDDVEEWAIGIAWRESRCSNVQNSEGASGQFQLMIPMHSALMSAVCGSADWANAECNIRTALKLYEGSGKRPWAL